MPTCQVCGSTAITIHNKIEHIKHKESFVMVSIPHSTCNNCSREFVSREQIKTGEYLISNLKQYGSMAERLKAPDCKSGLKGA